MTVFTSYAWASASGTALRTAPARASDSLNVRDFGSVGNGVADDYPAFNAAFTALGTAGGMVYVPPGTYNFITGTMIPPSNCFLQGAGIDATTILNTSTGGGIDCVLTVLMTMSGGSNAGLWPSTNTTYQINVPTLGANTVTTGTAASAGNFPVGGIIMISGGLHGTAFWYPSWYTTVTGTNASTGVITLAETLPFGGSSITTVQRILSLPKNITVRDMTLAVNSNISGQSGAIMEILGCDTFLIENCKFVNLSGLPGAGCAIGAPARRSGYRNCHATLAAGPVELFGCTESFIEGCTAYQTSFLVDGGSMDCNIINNFVKEPQENSAAFHAFHLSDYDLRLRVIGNVVVGLSGTFAGINSTGVPDTNRNHVIMGNTIVGVGTGSTNGINAPTCVIANNFFSNLQNGIQFNPSDSPFLTGNVFDATVNNPILPFSGARNDRNTQNPGLRAMPASTASPTVTGNGVYQLFQSGAFSVTGFTGGQAGDVIHINMGDANTTFANSGNLQMKGGINYNPASGVTMTFMALTSTVWTEVSRSA